MHQVVTVCMYVPGCPQSADRHTATKAHVLNHRQRGHETLLDTRGEDYNAPIRRERIDVGAYDFRPIERLGIGALVAQRSPLRFDLTDEITRTREHFNIHGRVCTRHSSVRRRHIAACNATPCSQTEYRTVGLREKIELPREISARLARVFSNE